MFKNAKLKNYTLEQIEFLYGKLRYLFIFKDYLRMVQKKAMVVCGWDDPTSSGGGSSTSSGGSGGK